MAATDPLKPVSLGEKPLRKIQADEPSAHEEEGGRRRVLASMLWGEPEDEPLFDNLLGRERKPAPPARPEPVPAAEPVLPPLALAEEEPDRAESHAASPGRGPHSRAHKRRACSFPGLIRILLPEQSFQPRVFAVRVVDLSPSGARLETKQFTPEFCELLRGEKRFARLEALVPSREKIIVGGKIAWAEYSEHLSGIGFQFSEIFDEVDRIFLDEVQDGTSTGSMALSPPQLDPFPNLTSVNEFHFTGSVMDAELVVARMGPTEFRAVPKGGRFEVTLPLKPDRSNFIAFTASRGELSSIPTPICIVHKAGVAETNSLQSRQLVDEWILDPTRDTLRVQLSGTAAQFHRVLRTMEAVLGQVDTVSMEIEVKGNSRAAADIMKDLRLKAF
jgi:hypothetical protein